MRPFFVLVGIGGGRVVDRGSLAVFPMILPLVMVIWWRPACLVSNLRGGDSVSIALLPLGVVMERLAWNVYPSWEKGMVRYIEGVVLPLC